MTTQQNFNPTNDGIADWCRHYVANLLDTPIEKIDATTEFDRFGLDSAMAVAMILELEEHLGGEVSPSLLFEYTTIAALADHLAARSGAGEVAA